MRSKSCPEKGLVRRETRGGKCIHAELVRKGPFPGANPTIHRILRDTVERNFRDRTGDWFSRCKSCPEMPRVRHERRNGQGLFPDNVGKARGLTSGSVFGARRVRIRNVHDDEAPPRTYTPRMPTLAGPLRYRSLDKRPCVESSAAARRLIPTPIAFEALTERHWFEFELDLRNENGMVFPRSSAASIERRKSRDCTHRSLTMG